MKLKTITLSDKTDDPLCVICPGHVDHKTFNKAFKEEGWNDIGHFRQDCLAYVYMIKTKDIYKKVPPSKKGAKPFTWTPWDE